MCFCRTSKHQTDNNSSKVVYKVMRLGHANKVQPLFYYTDEWYSIGCTIEAANNTPVVEIDQMGILEGQVVHAYTKDRAWEVNSFLKQMLGIYAVVVKCEIPAGVPYWVNEHSNEVAAKEMKITAIHL